MSPHLRKPKLPLFISLGVSQAYQPDLSVFNDLEVCQLISILDLAAEGSIEAQLHLSPKEVNGTAEYQQGNDGISLLSVNLSFGTEIGQGIFLAFQ